MRIGKYFAGILLLSAAVITISSKHAFAIQRIGMIDGTTIQIKEGSLNAPWYQVASGVTASNLKMYNNRIAYIDGSGNLWLKDGALNAQWHSEMSNVSSYDITDNRLLVVKTDKSVWLKEGSATAPWDSTTLETNGSSAVLSSSRIGVITGNGVLEVKLQANDQWKREFDGGLDKASMTDSRIVVQSFGYTYGKDGDLDAPWYKNGSLTHIDDSVSNVAIWNNDYCTVQNRNNDWTQLYCKLPPIYAANYFETGESVYWSYYTNSFTVGDDNNSPYFTVKGNNGGGGPYLWAASANGTWIQESTTGSEITSNHF